MSKLKLNFGDWQFAPSLKLCIFTIVLLTILVYLGTWQLGRAEEKNDLLILEQDKALLPPIPLEKITNPSLEKNRFTSACVDGLFIDKYTFLVDNQMFNHQVGYRVLTPLQSPGLEKWVLIDRGWIPLGKSRDELPKIKNIFGLQHVCGLISTISSGIILHPDQINKDSSWPVVIQTVNYKFIQEQANHPMYEFLLQINSEDVEHFKYPPMQSIVNSDKHIAYAIQWFLFALLLIFYFLYASIERRS